MGCDLFHPITLLDLGNCNSLTVSNCQSLLRYQNGSEETKHDLRTELQNSLQTGLDLRICNGPTVSDCRAVGAGPAGAAVAGPKVLENIIIMKEHPP